MYARLKMAFYWLQMAADVGSTITRCASCARNRLNLMKISNPMQLFPAQETLVSVGVEILGLLPSRRAEKDSSWSLMTFFKVKRSGAT